MYQLSLNRFFSISLVFLFFAARLQAQLVNIPDANFRDYLANDSPYASCMVDDGGVMKLDPDCAALLYENIDCPGMGISDLTGVRYFINAQSINCMNNNLTQLDLSGILALEYLEVSGNPLVSLNISETNFPEFTLSGVSTLTSVNASNCALLNGLYVNDNPNLTQLNVSNCPYLQTLECPNNALTTLNLTGSNAFYYIECSGNQLTTLDVSHCADLRTLYCNNNNLSSIAYSATDVLEDLNVQNNELSSLTTLPETLCDLGATGNSITCLPNVPTQCSTTFTADVAQDGQGGYIVCQTPLVAIPDANFMSFLLSTAPFSACMEGTAPNQKLNPQKAAAVTANMVCANLNITNLSGIEYFTALTHLECNGNALTTLDVSKNLQLVYLNCEQSSLTTIDVSANAALQYLKSSVTSVSGTLPNSLCEFYAAELTCLPNLPACATFTCNTAKDGQGGYKICEVGLENSENIFALSLYPNPTNGRFILQFQTADKGRAQVAIQDLNGRTLWTQNLETNVGFNQFEIQAATLPAGCFVLQLQGNGCATKSLFVKQ